MLWSNLGDNEIGSTLVAQLAALIFFLTFPLFWIPWTYVTRVEVGEDLHISTVLKSLTLSWNDVQQVALLSRESSIVGLSSIEHNMQSASSLLPVFKLEDGSSYRGIVRGSEIPTLQLMWQENSHLLPDGESGCKTPRELITRVFEFTDKAVSLQSGLLVHRLFEIPASVSQHPRIKFLPQLLRGYMEQKNTVDFEEFTDDPDVDSPFIVAEAASDDFDGASNEEDRIVLSRVAMTKDAIQLWRFNPSAVDFLLNIHDSDTAEA